MRSGAIRTDDIAISEGWGEMSVVVSIAREEPLCVKATADTARVWGRNDKGYGFFGFGTMAYPGGGNLEVTFNIGVRPHGNFAEFPNFPHELEISGDLTDDSAQVGVFHVHHGKATVAIMLPTLQDELETNPDQSIELDRVVLAKGAATHIRMSVSLRLSAAAHAADDARADEDAQFRQAEIGVAVHGTARAASTVAGGAPSTRAFVEQTSTAIVFAQGGVVRLSEIVAVGQILIVRHSASNQEAACRVLSVRHSANAKNYVDLEFLQPTPGFWGTGSPSAEQISAKDSVPPEDAAAEKHKTLAAPKAKATPPAARGAAAGETPKSAPAENARNPFSKLRDEPALAQAPIANQPAPNPPQAPLAQPEPVVSAPEPAPLEVATLAPVSAVAADAAAVAPPAGDAAPRIAPSVLVPPRVFPSLIFPSLTGTASPKRDAASAGKRATPPSSVPKIAAQPAARPALSPAKPASGAADLPADAILSGESAHGWNRESRSKPLRVAVAVVAAAALAVAVGVGFYRWHERNELSADSLALIEAASSNSDAAVETEPAPAAGPTAATGTAPAAPSTDSTAPDSVSAPATAKRAAAQTAPPALRQSARGPSVVANTGMSAPTAGIASTASQAAPAIPAPVPTDATYVGILPALAEASGPAAPAPVPAAAAVQARSVLQPPRLIAAASPQYPAAAQAERVAGDVAVELLIDEKGKVASATVLSGPAMLREAALDALRRSKYAPAVLDGKPTAAHVVVQIHFKL